jgi:hypothetical protein
MRSGLGLNSKQGQIGSEPAGSTFDREDKNKSAMNNIDHPESFRMSGSIIHRANSQVSLHGDYSQVRNQAKNEQAQRIKERFVNVKNYVPKIEQQLKKKKSNSPSKAVVTPYRT